MWQLRHLLMSVLAMLSVGMIGAQDPGKDGQKPGLNEPELAVEEPGIYVIKPDGSDERKLSHGRWPDWSPDGKKIAFSRGGLPGGGAKIGAAVSISNADGSDEKYVAEGNCPSWSPDGKKIALCFRQEEAPPEIRIVDLKTTDLHGQATRQGRRSLSALQIAPLKNQPSARGVMMMCKG
jgi:dipeptidyl aminopeptidase/acylaminoacyl peptidase